MPYRETFADSKDLADVYLNNDALTDTRASFALATSFLASNL